ncbi:hypothetical protein B0I08_10421 [Glaciihabitans tibetensis]|uniref:Sugar lactone lactonase YvrE n=1 Tax=Glaciihabitans tibetensis TaxID=1266600 RepID=A0A2T0VDR3_9MICO|nr:ScyD/ScyE family protein [Glaciihabitans tibetensis]PRY68319.1 hypothetical protein B0I08_10421 [Glaciihabitans tibetensis]
MKIARTAWLAVTLTAAMLVSCAPQSGVDDRLLGGMIRDDHLKVRVLASGLNGTGGSAIGPDGALYVTDRVAGEVIRVNTTTGEKSTFATGLPPPLSMSGGPIDIAFVGQVAYVLVADVDAGPGGDRVNGIYRIDDRDSWTVVADLGAFTRANPPHNPVTLMEELAPAIEPVQHGFLVTDGQRERLLAVTREGEVSVLLTFGNVTPTGIARLGRSVYIAQTGSMPYGAERGRVVGILGGESEAVQVASGDSPLVDVEFAGCDALYALSRGYALPGATALPRTGRLLRVNGDGSLSRVVGGLDLPTSVEFADGAAFVVAGDEVLRIDNVPGDANPQHPGVRCRHQSRPQAAAQPMWGRAG